MRLFAKFEIQFNAQLVWACLGFTACLAMTSAAHLDFTAPPLPLRPVMLFTGEALGCITSAFVGHLAKPLRPKSRSAIHALLLATLLVISLSLMANEQSKAPFSSATVILLLFYGFLIGCCYVIQGTFVCTLGIKSCVAVITGATVLSGIVICIGVAVLTWPTILLANVVFLVALGVSWHKCGHRPLESCEEPRPDAAPIISSVRPFIPLAIGVSLFTVCLALSANAGAGQGSDITSGITGSLLSTIVSLFFLLVLCYGRRGFDFNSFWLLLLTMICVAHLIESLGQSWVGLALIVVHSAQGVMVVLVYLSLADLASRSRFAPLVIFGIGWSIYTASMALGYLAAVLLNYRLGVTSQPLLVISILTICSFILVGTFGSKDSKLLVDLKPAAPRIDVFSQAVDIAAKKYGLTAREHEVALLYGQGRSRDFIADQLVLSPNTVRGHIRNIYQKMGVVDKQGLIDSILQCEPAPPDEE